jgi:plasmid stabilization system protein ParE
MAYLVELTLRAERDLNYMYEWISVDDSAVAARWFDELRRPSRPLNDFRAAVPQFLKGRRPNVVCATCSMARSMISTASFTKSTNGARWFVY